MRAARCAGWLAQGLLVRGEIAREQRLAGSSRSGCSTRRITTAWSGGCLLVPVAIQSFDRDPATAHAIFGQAAEIG